MKFKLTVISVQIIESFHVQYTRTAAFSILRVCQGILPPWPNLACTPPLSKSTYEKRVGDKRCEFGSGCISGPIRWTTGRIHRRQSEYPKTEEHMFWSAIYLEESGQEMWCSFQGSHWSHLGRMSLFPFHADNSLSDSHLP